MGSKKRKAKRQQRSVGRLKITPATIVGGAMGAGLMAAGLYSALYRKEYGAFYLVALGVLLVLAVGWGSIRSRRSVRR